MADKTELLVERLRGGDTQALAEFIAAHRARLLGYIERSLGTALRRKVEADDILQEASVEAVRSLAGADLAQRDPFGWLCQIAERRIIDAHRRFFSQKRDAAREVALIGGEGSRRGLIDLLVASLTTPSKVFSRNQREARLLAAIESLPEEQRTALRLRYVENLPSKEIAARLGKTDGAVRVLLTRSLKRLHDLLGPGESG